MGPRVPAFILSPFVTAGKADHTIYDHTSILKTILVHNRHKLPGSVIGSFGERVNQAAHFGQSLDLDSARPTPQPFDPMRRRPTRPRPTGPVIDAVLTGGAVGTGGGVGGIGGIGGGVFGIPPDLVLQPSGPPVIPPRTVSIVPRTAVPQVDVEQPDFHAALKDALKPRR